jgi:hypothetical protein
VYKAAATDVDAGQTAALNYSLTGTDADKFNINASTGDVTLKASADYETKSSYNFNVVATDSGTDHLTATQAVTINVTDVNEAPVMNSGSTGSVTENAATSTVVYTAKATDVDAGQTLTYSLSGTDATQLNINASTGEVTLKISADYETKSSYSFNVVATDSGANHLTATQAVLVGVLDVVNEGSIITNVVQVSSGKYTATQGVVDIFKIDASTFTGGSIDGFEAGDKIEISNWGEPIVDPQGVESDPAYFDFIIGQDGKLLSMYGLQTYFTSDGGVIYNATTFNDVYGPSAVTFAVIG